MFRATNASVPPAPTNIAVPRMITNFVLTRRAMRYLLVLLPGSAASGLGECSALGIRKTRFHLRKRHTNAIRDRLLRLLLRAVLLPVSDPYLGLQVVRVLVRRLPETARHFLRRRHVVAVHL